MVIPVSDSGPAFDPHSHLVNDVPGDAAGTRELVHPGDVLGDWFDDSSESTGQLADMLTEAYEAKATPETSTDELAAIAVDVVQRQYLGNYATAIEPADVAELVDPRHALADWFSHGAEPLDEPFSMLAVAFETSADEHSSSGELADIAIDTIQRYLRDCVAETDG